MKDNYEEFKIIFYGNEDDTHKMEKELEIEKEKKQDDLHPLYLNLCWLAKNNFIPVSENFFYKK